MINSASVSLYFELARKPDLRGVWRNSGAPCSSACSCRGERSTEMHSPGKAISAVPGTKTAPTALLLPQLYLCPLLSSLTWASFCFRWNHWPCEHLNLPGSFLKVSKMLKEYRRGCSSQKLRGQLLQNLSPEHAYIQHVPKLCSPSSAEHKAGR